MRGFVLFCISLLLVFRLSAYVMDCPVPVPSIHSHGSSVILVSAHSMQTSFSKQTSQRSHLQVMDPHFVVIKMEWVPAIMDWLHCTADNLGIDLSRGEIHRFDNDNIARLMSTVSNARLSQEKNMKASLPLGYIKMQRNKPWKNHPADNKVYEYILMYTENGFLVMDPYHKEYELLKDHPNHAFIKAALF